MKILLCPNPEKKGSIPCTKQTVERLVQLSAVPMLDEQFRRYITNSEGCVFGDYKQLMRDCDVLLPIGGDGTILRAVKHAIKADKPVIGINTGRVGFLTQIEGWELDRLGLLVKGNYRIEERMMLEALVQTETGEKSFHSLNDIILTRSSHRLTEIGVYCKGQLVVQHRADALIFATPTGSTGYTLSAGGSVVDPSFSAILMTAVCPVTTYNRSLILPPEKAYVARLEESCRNATLDIMADGDIVAKVTNTQTIAIRRFEKTAKLIDLGLNDFYSNLRDKLLLRR